jgi:rhodanese-related sulfurtransferase
MVAEIMRDELAALLSSHPPVLLEALGEPYFRKGHLPGAKRIDYLQAIDQVQAMQIAAEAPIVVYCASDTCKNSHLAAQALAGAGYANVRVYVEGKAGWQHAGLTLVRD